MSAEREAVLAVGILYELHAVHPRRVQDLWRGRVFDRYRDLAARMRAARGAALALDVARMLRQLDELNAAAGIRQVLLAEEEEEEEDEEEEDGYALVIVQREAADDVD